MDQNNNVVQIDGRDVKQLVLAEHFIWLTPGQILQRVDSIARGFQQMGINEGEKILLYAENSLEWFIASLALQRINAVAVTMFSILSKLSQYYWTISQIVQQFLHEASEHNA